MTSNFLLVAKTESLKRKAKKYRHKAGCLSRATRLSITRSVAFRPHLAMSLALSVIV